jgi:zinc finger SWIM domain-containing protein 3
MEFNAESVAVDTCFKNKEELKVTCQMLTIKENFEYSVSKSDRSRLTLKCSKEDCLWRLHASKMTDEIDSSFQIKTMNAEHNCMKVQHLGHRQASAKFIEKQIQTKLNDNVFYRSINIKQNICCKHDILMIYKQFYQAKQQALQAINDTEKNAYATMSKYCKDLKRNNSESTIVLECIEEKKNKS